MRIILTSLLLFISINLFSQEERLTSYVFQDSGKNYVVRLDKKLAPAFYNFISWADIFNYKYKERLKDVEGIYLNTLNNEDNVGQAFLFKDKKDYIIINSNLKLNEIIHMVLFHELYHLFANEYRDNHCYDSLCSSIMSPALDGNIVRTFKNWNKEVAKLFAGLKVIKNGKQEDHITECKIFSTGKE